MGQLEERKREGSSMLILGCVISSGGFSLWWLSWILWLSASLAVMTINFDSVELGIKTPNAKFSS
jgi:hypothetical protein